MSFSLLDLPLLSRAKVGRDEQLRADSAALAEGWRTARVLLVDGRGRFAARGGALVFRPAHEISPAPPSEGAVFLGEHSVGEHSPGGPGGAHLWAVRVAEIQTAEAEVDLLDLRMAGHTLCAVEASVASTAAAMLAWQGRSKFAPWSGEPMSLGKGGWVRVASDGKEEFPRTDPAVICLVHDGADQVLLARQPAWPQRWFSILAGFCEPGESLEQCVEREVAEEVGVDVSNVAYLGSQPWPFPRSLMLGFRATADPAQPVVPADGEIEEARWFHLDEVVEALGLGGARSPSPAGWGDEAPGAALLLPGSVSIARAMIESWARSRITPARR